MWSGRLKTYPLQRNILAFAQMDYRKTMSLHQDGSHQEQEMNTRPFEYKTVPTTQLQHSVPVLVRLSFNYGSVVSYFHLLQNKHHGYMRIYVSCSLTLSIVTTKHKIKLWHVHKQIQSSRDLVIKFSLITNCVTYWYCHPLNPPY